MKHLFENHDLQTEKCGQFIDMTGDLLAMVERSGVSNGMALVYSPHTTCAVVINERESGFIEDFNEFLERVAPCEGPYYRHDDLSIRTEGLEDDPHDVPNGHSHVRAAMLSSSSQALPIVDGKLLLGHYQKVFFCELDRARERKVFMQVIGE
jgi:secondary thiamine-phosphate synthase enzyme